MTLMTRIVVADPIGRDRLWTAARLSIGTPEDVPTKDDRDGSLCNPLGCGLPGWLILNFGTDGPYDSEEAWREAEDEEGPLGEREPYPHPWPIAYSIGLDTGYGSRSSNGAGCSDLHAAWVAWMGTWLNEQGARWRWHNEFTGEWHEGIHSVTDLGSPGYGCEGMALDLLDYRVPAPEMAASYRTLALIF